MFAKGRVAEINTDVTFQCLWDGSPKVMDSGRISGAGVTVPDRLQDHLHGFELNHEFGGYPITVRAKVIYHDYFSLFYLYELHCTSMDKYP